MSEKRIDHINISVPNLARSIDYYTKVMGFTIQNRFKGGGMEFVFMSDGSTTYELMENPSLKETRIDHIAYVSDDIQKDYDAFKAINPDLLLGDIGYVDFLFENGVYYFFIKGVGNEKIEFCQKKPL